MRRGPATLTVGGAAPGAPAAGVLPSRPPGLLLAVPLALRDLEPWTPGLGTPRRLVPVSEGPEPRRKDSGCLDFTPGKKPSARGTVLPFLESLLTEWFCKWRTCFWEEVLQVGVRRPGIEEVTTSPGFPLGARQELLNLFSSADQV